MRGIVLAGGTGSRLWPITHVVSKQLLPIYDKPLIYYPISTLMLAGVRNILIITTPQDASDFQSLLGDGSQFGITIDYAAQETPRGLADAFIIGENFIHGESVLMVLGDNIFHGAGLGRELKNLLPASGAHIFTYPVSEPSRYGILNLNKDDSPRSVVEKPTESKSNLAITGLYYFDKDVAGIAKTIQPSTRGEIEITSIIEDYLNRGLLSFTGLSRGIAWLDTGTPDSMYEAATFVKVIEDRTGLKIACLEEIAFLNKWIDLSQLKKLSDTYPNNSYGNYIRAILKRHS
jgi:glucose-1-phosphate thymidylyltransferase